MSYLRPTRTRSRHLRSALSRMEVTTREILVSTLIVAVMVGVGVWISSPILTKATSKYLEVASSVVVSDAEKFDYIKRTDAGMFIAEGTLYVTDTVRIPELPNAYSFVRKVKEEYRTHTETYRDSDGNSHTRTYHSWDEVKHWDYRAENGVFLGQHFNMKELYRYHPKKEATIKVDTKWYETETRYVYYTCPPSFDGILIGSASEHKYNDVKFKEGTTPIRYLDQNERKINMGTAIFWLLWILFTGALVVGFYALENKWLY